MPTDWITVSRSQRWSCQRFTFCSVFARIMEFPLQYGPMDGRTDWRAPPGNYALPENEVHVWRVALHWPAASIAALKRILSPDERARADRFHFEIDHRRHVVGRGVLRLLLAKCLGMAPEGLRFDYGARHKPS